MSNDILMTVFRCRRVAVLSKCFDEPELDSANTLRLIDESRYTDHKINSSLYKCRFSIRPALLSSHRCLGQKRLYIYHKWQHMVF